MNEIKGIWITWEFQRRNIGISSALDYPLYQIDIKSWRPIRYLKSILLTCKVIHKVKPNIVVAQNPSIILAILIVLYKKIGNYQPIIDAHNSGIFPFEGRSKILMKLSRFIQRKALLTIVSNQELANIVEKNGGNAFVLPDAIPPSPVKINSLQLEGRINLTCICTFNEDEPYQEILKASSLLSDDIHVYFTGKFNGKINPSKLSKNVHLTGFVPEHEYWELLKSSDIIIDLTLRENCLVCGAYEGVALNKPLIISNTNVLKKYFSKGCVYAEPEQNDIFRAMMEAVNNIENLQNDITNLRKEIEIEWENKISRLKSKLNMLVYY